MAKIKVINKRPIAESTNFTNVPSQTVLSFGDFRVETNFNPRVVRNYSNTLSSFVSPITLETLKITEEESKLVYGISNEVVLNIDKSDLGGYVKYGSLTELLRVSTENIILGFPSSVFVTYQPATGKVFSVFNFSYDSLSNVSYFEITTNAVVNKFGLVLNDGNNQLPQGNELRNLNLSFDKYVIWRKDKPLDNNHYIIDFTGTTSSSNFLKLKVNGNPFPDLSGGTQGFFEYHLKPKPFYYNKFVSELSSLESYFLNEKTVDGYNITLKKPNILENGEVSYSDQDVLWPTSDGYNVDIVGYRYELFLEQLGTIGSDYDLFKTDVISRLLVPQSLKIYDNTENEKMSKLLRIYGRQFDELKVYIDAIANINRVTYSKDKNVPDVLVKNLAKTVGWDVSTLVTDNDLLEGFFSTEQKTSTDLLPSEVDIELWRRILINTDYLFRTKGTRDAIKTMFLLVGIPEPFINISEYVYTVDEKIDPNLVTVTLDNLKSATLPYNDAGYPIAPKETSTFYFQMSGTTDSGQAYMDNFRAVGFKLNRTVDNKKSWVRDGFVERTHYSSPNYFQQESDLVINTKEIDVTLDVARGIEYDMYYYNQITNFPIANTGITTPYLYINIPFTFGLSANTFTIAEEPQGDIQVNFNGITLHKGTGVNDKDYYINPMDSKQVILNGNVAQTYSNGYKDIITLTYAHDRLTTTGYTNIDYIVTHVTANPDGMTIPLPEVPLGDIQLVVNGITLSKGNTLYTGDFVINPTNAQEIIVVNEELKNYLITNPVLVISYFKSSQSETFSKKSELYRIDTYSGTKFFYNSSIGKYVYVLDYEPPHVEAIKFLVNGITLQNGTDFTLNNFNRKQVFLNSSSIGLGYLIQVFYGTDSEVVLPTVNFGDFVFPDMSQITFLEYVELINRRLINVKNRKTITDHEGGLYPTLTKLYEEYLKRAYATPPVTQSNGYTFENLYPFINKFNAYFHRFIDEMLSSTIILKKGGILIRNTSYSKQKFPYRRGVSFDPTLRYLGDDGSMFKKRVPEVQFNYSWTGLTCVIEELFPTGYTFSFNEISRSLLADDSGDRFETLTVEYKLGITPSASTNVFFDLDFKIQQIGVIDDLSTCGISNNIQIKKNSVTVFSKSITGVTNQITGKTINIDNASDIRVIYTLHAETDNDIDNADTTGIVQITGITQTSGATVAINNSLPLTISETAETPQGELELYALNVNVLTGINQSVEKSTDSGSTFTSINTVVAPTGGSYIYRYISFADGVGYAGGITDVSPSNAPHLIRTTNGGSSWTNMRTNIPSGGAFGQYNGGGSGLIPYILNKSTAFVGYRDGLFKTTDTGNTWTFKQLFSSVELGGAQIRITGMHFFDANIGFCVALPEVGIVNGLFKTIDGGDTWTKVSGITGTQLSFSPSNKVGYLASSTSLYRTVNSGTTWTNIGAGLPISIFGSVAIWAIDDNNVLLGLNSSGLFNPQYTIHRSTNQGGSWTQVYDTGSPGYMGYFDFEEGNQVGFIPIGINAGSIDYGVLKTVNGGLTWTFTSTPNKQISVINVEKNGIL